MNSVSATTHTSIEYDILHALEDDVADYDPEIMLELIDIFLQDSAEHLVGIGRAIEGGDYRKIEISAHSLRSSSATFGALILSNFCMRLEKCARTSQNECIVETLAEARQEFALVEAILRVQRVKWVKAVAE
jgi:HPt (histidine-containing phosphotransfer) domain-containing protein